MSRDDDYDVEEHFHDEERYCANSDAVIDGVRLMEGCSVMITIDPTREVAVYQFKKDGREAECFVHARESNKTTFDNICLTCVGLGIDWKVALELGESAPSPDIW